MLDYENKLEKLNKKQLKEEALRWIKANKGWIDHVEFPTKFQELFEELLNKEVNK